MSSMRYITECKMKKSKLLGKKVFQFRYKQGLVVYSSINRILSNVSILVRAGYIHSLVSWNSFQLLTDLFPVFFITRLIVYIYSLFISNFLPGTITGIGDYLKRKKTKRKGEKRKKFRNKGNASGRPRNIGKRRNKCNKTRERGLINPKSNN